MSRRYYCRSHNRTVKSGQILVSPSKFGQTALSCTEHKGCYFHLLAPSLLHSSSPLCFASADYCLSSCITYCVRSRITAFSSQHPLPPLPVLLEQILTKLSYIIPTAAARVRSRVWSSWICVDKVALSRFSQSTSVSPANIHSTYCSTITLTYHLGLVQQARSGRSTRDLVQPH
jgi:hypothetical protein